MAINGDGFFVVQKPSGFTGNRPVFDGIDRYTRRGDFQPDKNGFLVNGAGYYLMGIPIDPTTGNLVGSVPQVLQFQNDFLPAQATTQIEYRANLASYPRRQCTISMCRSRSCSIRPTLRQIRRPAGPALSSDREATSSSMKRSAAERSPRSMRKARR